MKREALLKSLIRQRSICRNFFLFSLALVLLVFLSHYYFKRGDQLASTHFIMCVISLGLFIHSDFKIKLLLLQKQAEKAIGAASAGHAKDD